MTGTEVSLDPQSLLNEATDRTGGLTDLGEAPFVDPLNLFTDSLEKEARLNAVGRMIAKERILGHAVNRLLYVNDRKRFPEIAKQEIVRPVFIFGLPRTGTTILHDILAQDPANRAPMTWEVTFPSPPPETATFDTDPRIATCEATFPERDARQPGFKAIHPMGAQLAQECIVMWGEAMCTPLFHNQFRVPSYQDWTARLQCVVLRALEVRAAQEFPEARFYDMRFSDFVVDQFEVVKKIYEALEIPMTDEGAARMRAFIEANPKGKHGEHRYTPEEYGVQPDAVRHDFRKYIEQFDLLPK